MARGGPPGTRTEGRPSTTPPPRHRSRRPGGRAARRVIVRSHTTPLAATAQTVVAACGDQPADLLGERVRRHPARPAHARHARTPRVRIEVVADRLPRRHTRHRASKDAHVDTRSVLEHRGTAATARLGERRSCDERGEGEQCGEQLKTRETHDPPNDERRTVMTRPGCRRCCVMPPTSGTALRARPTAGCTNMRRLPRACGRVVTPGPMARVGLPSRVEPLPNRARAMCAWPAVRVNQAWPTARAGAPERDERGWVRDGPANPLSFLAHGIAERGLSATLQLVVSRAPEVSAQSRSALPRLPHGRRATTRGGLAKEVRAPYYLVRVPYQAAGGR
jgi:hypothetical protein